MITDSKFERLVRRLLADAGVDEPVSQFSIRDGDRFIAEVDLAWPDRMVAAELQSKKHHLHTKGFERDKQRLNDARLHGWNVLEYTFKAYRTEPSRLIREIQTALAQRSGAA